MKKLNSIKPYIKKDSKNKALHFKGKELVIHIPKRYETYGLLEVGNTVKTLGIMNLVFNEKEYAPLCILGIVEIVPSEIEEIVINNSNYYKLTLNDGDTLIKHLDIIQDGSIPYSIFMEFVSYGKLPYFFSYENVSKIFDTTKKMTGVGLDIDHVIYEMVFAHLHRDKEKKSIFYRLTDMKKDPLYIPLRSVELGTQSTTAKLLGSYFNDGLTASLITENTTHYDIEDYLRR